ncbi:hypothetical protein GGI15_003459 [Coemansia interrupta]|uniref:Nuclear speckle splicing regulatory protein 1 N-terminal domain-containing protein n=1 Tax=Coemansia interrupta TaxID=1126814 RepID=A0A9W8LGH4_9FUNG|nr:hypothetical protein GGI15_003459 [Coemansia interrupta]
MRKTTAIKSGLNVRKAGGAVQPAVRSSADVKSAFGSSAAPDHPAAHRPIVPTKPTTASSTLDPSVYAYDALYDEISTTRQRLRSTDKDDRRPKYMEKLIETAKQRQVQKEVARERLLEKERQREGEEFAEKESFVTAGYRKQKEERRRMVEDEERREAEEEEDRRGGDFRQQFLRHVDRRDVARAMDAQESEEAEGKESAQRKNRALGAGLNVVSASRKVDAGGRRIESERPAQRPARQHRGRELDDEVHRQEARRAEAKELQRKALVQKYARRNNDAAVEAARQRYLERKHLRAHV